MAKKKREEKLQGLPQHALENKALSGLASLRARLPGAEKPAEAAPAPTVESADTENTENTGPYGAKLVICRERKGHGGKTATRLTGLQGSVAELDAIAKKLRKALGCGATREDEDVLLQGVQGPRLESWLRGQGARNIVIGN